MKYFYVLLLFFFMSFTTIFSQNNLDHKMKTDNIQSDNANVESVVVYNTTGTTSKYSYTYDVNGEIATRLKEIFQNDQWVNNTRDSSTYDENGNQLTLYYYIWKYTDSWDWAYYSRITYTYDENSNILSYISESWQNEDWVGTTKYTYTYDANGNYLTYLYEKFELQGTWQWVTYKEYISTYDKNDNLLTEKKENLRNGLVTITRTTNSYDADGYLFESIDEILINEEWILTDRHTLTSDSEGNPLTSLFEEWISDAWVPTYREASTYNSNGDYLTWNQDEWNGEEWILSQTEVYTYDEDGNWLSYHYNYYEGGELNYTEQQLFTYNSAGKELSWIYQYMESGEWVNGNQKTSIYNQDGNLETKFNEKWDGMQWVYLNNYYLGFVDYKDRFYVFNGYKIEITYDGSTDVEDNLDYTNLQLNCYPNPASDINTIEYFVSEPTTVSLSIINATGRVMDVIFSDQMQDQGNHSLDIDVNNYVPGAYYYIIQTGYKQEIKKFIILR